MQTDEVQDKIHKINDSYGLENYGVWEISNVFCHNSEIALWAAGWYVLYGTKFSEYTG